MSLCLLTHHAPFQIFCPAATLSFVSLRLPIAMLLPLLSSVPPRSCSACANPAPSNPPARCPHCTCAPLEQRCLSADTHLDTLLIRTPPFSPLFCTASIFSRQPDCSTGWSILRGAFPNHTTQVGYSTAPSHFAVATCALLVPTRQNRGCEAPSACIVDSPPHHAQSQLRGRFDSRVALARGGAGGGVFR